MSKRSWITLLIGLNLVLLASLILSRGGMPAAHAQPAPLAENLLLVTGEIRDGVDALYVIDLNTRRMHVYIPNRDMNNRRIGYVGWRDLLREFRGGQ